MASCYAEYFGKRAWAVWPNTNWGQTLSTPVRMTALANPETMPVVTSTTYKWPLLGCASSLQMLPCVCWFMDGVPEKGVCQQRLCIWRGDVTRYVLRFTGHNPRFGRKKLLFWSVFKLGVCPARDSQLLTSLECTWKEKNLNQPWTGEECQIFWKHHQNPTISQNFQRRQRIVCISMEKVLKAVETIPSFTCSLKGESNCYE